MNETGVFIKETFETILVSTTLMHEEIHWFADTKITKVQDKQKKLKWEILPYNTTAKEKTEREDGFHLRGLVLISFAKLNQKELKLSKSRTTT